jgi:AhpD family alkylhydroperoxidase
MKVMTGLHTFLHGCGLDRTLLELVKLRASQINGCAHCIDMHVKELRAMGEGEQRLHLLDAWEESPFYSDRERAALTWCEAVTRITEGCVPDEVYESAQVRRNSIIDNQQPIVAPADDARHRHISVGLIMLNGTRRLGAHPISA